VSPSRPDLEPHEPVRAVFFGDVPHRVAGAQKSLLAALGRLPAFGVTPLVLFPHEGAFVELCRAAGLYVEVLPAPPSFEVYGRALMRASLPAQALTLAREGLPYALALGRRARALGASVLHFNTPRGIVMAGLAGKLVGLGTVLHLRGSATIGRLYWTVAESLADRIVLVAGALRDDLSWLGARKARVVYNGVRVPPERARDAARGALVEALAESPELAREGLSASALTEGPLFVSLSSPVPFKGLHHLVDAAAMAGRRGVLGHYLLAGTGNDPSYEAWLRARRDDAGLRGRVALVGHVEAPEALLAAADALVLPSVAEETLAWGGAPPRRVRGTEGLPRSVLECMAAGRVAVASDVAGVREQLEHGVTGLVVPPGDASALADALVRVAREPERVASMGVAARARVEARFSVDAAAAGLADVLREVARP
jgi:glycosyltransferase involved in cell wall biosynthesis